MSNFIRLLRVAKAWTGKLRRTVYYDTADARMILNELGMQMSPAALEYMTSSDLIMEEFLQCIYEAEEVLGKSLISEGGMQISPVWKTRVLEADGILVFTLMDGKKEKIFAEFRMPGAKNKESGRIVAPDFEVEIQEDGSPEGSEKKPGKGNNPEVKINWE